MYVYYWDAPLSECLIDYFTMWYFLLLIPYYTHVILDHYERNRPLNQAFLNMKGLYVDKYRRVHHMQNPYRHGAKFGRQFFKRSLIKVRSQRRKRMIINKYGYY